MSNETRWEQLQVLAKEYTDPWRVEQAMESVEEHIFDGSESLDDLLESLESSSVPRYAVFELHDDGGDNWYMPQEYEIMLVADHREIEEHVKEMLKQGVETDQISVYDLDGSFKEVRLSIALNPSVLVLDKE